MDAILASPQEGLEASSAAWIAACTPCPQAGAVRFAHPAVDEGEGRVNAGRDVLVGEPRADLVEAEIQPRAGEHDPQTPHHETGPERVPHRLAQDQRQPSPVAGRATLG